MSETYYKAIRLDGTDWWTGTVRWIPEDGAIPEGGWLVEHPTPGPVGDGHAAGYLSVATIPTDCSGMRWPSRLLRVEPVGEVWSPHPVGLPRKRAGHAWRVVEERPAHEALGPQGREVAALIESAHGLTPDQLAAIDAAGEAAWDAAWDAAWGAVWEVVWDATRGAALAVLVRDLITPEQYGLLTEPWRTVMGDPMGGRAMSDYVTEWLDAVRADLDAATPGPWRTEWDDADKWHSITGTGHDLGGGLWVVCPAVATVEAGWDADANLIAHAPDRLDRMERALRGVTLMHEPEPEEVQTADGFDRIVFCRECGLEWGDDGCPTVTTIQEALG